MNAQSETTWSGRWPTLAAKDASIQRDWKSVLREMHLECAAEWMESSVYWRGQSAKHLVNENAVLAAEALMYSDARAEYAREDLRKVGFTETEIEQWEIAHGARCRATQAQTN